MKSTAQTPFAERAGRTLGRAWETALRLERKANGYLVAQGMNVSLAKGMLWAAKLALLALLLYGAFWVALLLGFALLVMWSSGNVPIEDEEEKAEWRFGWSGYGLYHGEVRIDPDYLNDDG
ncbi:hypothetical protein AGMMS50256_33730 [Betaproteobacteria bacterium]|nr:hypothetical protein AGMMS50256_33730 [Betaproteobacteria bacterium]